MRDTDATCRDDDREMYLHALRQREAQCLRQHELRSTDALLANLADPPGALFVRALFDRLGFDEDRPFDLLLDHKLVQARWLRAFAGDVAPYTLPFDFQDASRAGFADRLSALFPGGFHIKLARGDSSGGQGDAATGLSITEARACAEATPDGLPNVIVQEQLDILEEYRVHSLGQAVVPELTYRRYAFGEGTPPLADAVEDFVRTLLARLPGAVIDEALCGWDIVRLANERWRVVEVNFSGRHRAHRPGFQCSGFLCVPEPGEETIAKLLVFCAAKVSPRALLEDLSFTAPAHEPYRRLGLRIARNVRLLDRHLGRMPMPRPVPATTQSLAAVVHAGGASAARIGLLLDSLRQRADSVTSCMLLCTAGEQPALQEISARAGCPVIDYATLLPANAACDDRTTRAVAEIAVTNLIHEHRILFLDATAICIDDPAKLFDQDGRSPVHRFLRDPWPGSYAAAERVLATRRSGWSHRLAPYIAARVVLQRMRDHIAGQRSGDWRCAILDEVDWTTGAGYFVFAEAFDLFDQHHYAANRSLVGGSISHPGNWKRWQAGNALHRDQGYAFTRVEPEAIDDPTLIARWDAVSTETPATGRLRQLDRPATATTALRCDDTRDTSGCGLDPA